MDKRKRQIAMHIALKCEEERSRLEEQIPEDLHT